MASSAVRPWPALPGCSASSRTRSRLGSAPTPDSCACSTTAPAGDALRASSCVLSHPRTSARSMSTSVWSPPARNCYPASTSNSSTVGEAPLSRRHLRRRRGQLGLLASLRRTPDPDALRAQPGHQAKRATAPDRPELRSLRALASIRRPPQVDQRRSWARSRLSRHGSRRASSCSGPPASGPTTASQSCRRAGQQRTGAGQTSRCSGHGTTTISRSNWPALTHLPGLASLTSASDIGSE